jgi:hypothetical protein
VRLPAGSALLYGALSHVAARGLDNYADEVVPCPELVYTIVDPYGFTKSLLTIASALDFLWGRGMVHCRLLAV